MPEIDVDPGSVVMLEYGPFLRTVTSWKGGP